MQTGYVIVILGLVLILALIAVLVWLFLRDAGRSTHTNVKEQHVVQELYSQDLQKRVFIVEYGDDSYQVIYSYYSNKVINIAGEVVGWLTLKNKPVVRSLFEAVELAEKWLHEEPQQS